MLRPWLCGIDGILHTGVVRLIERSRRLKEQTLEDEDEEDWDGARVWKDSGDRDRDGLTPEGTSGVTPSESTVSTQANITADSVQDSQTIDDGGKPVPPESGTQSLSSSSRDKTHEATGALHEAMDIIFDKDGAEGGGAGPRVLVESIQWELLFSVAVGRGSFLKELDVRRGEKDGLMTATGFATMSRAMEVRRDCSLAYVLRDGKLTAITNITWTESQVFLNCCLRDGDVTSALRLANMANTFHKLYVTYCFRPTITLTFLNAVDRLLLYPTCGG